MNRTEPPVPRVLSADRLHDALADVGGTARPDYLDDLVRQAARTRQRPAWTFPERWIPMTLITYPGTRARPASPGWRPIVAVGLALAIVAGVIAGAASLLHLERLQAPTMPTVRGVAPFGPPSLGPGVQLGAMDVADDGRIVVPDVAGGRILVIAADGATVQPLGAPGREPGEFDFQRHPSDPGSYLGGAAWMPDGSIVVADTVNRRVQVLSTDGTVLATWGGYGPADGQFVEPFDVAVGPDGTVHVVDDQRDDISRFDASGTFRDRIGRHGAGDGEMDFTSGIAVDADGNVFNADYGNQRVQSWAADGSFRWSTAIPLGADPLESQPVDVDVDRDGFAYVTTVDRRLLILAPDGRIVLTWSDPTDSGTGPISVAVGPDGAVYLGSLIDGRLRRLTMERTALVVASAAPTAPVGVPEPSPSPVGNTAALVSFSPEGTFPLPLTLTAPENWALSTETRGAYDIRLVRDTETTPAYVTVFLPLDAYADPCQVSDGTIQPPIGPGVDDLVAALIAQPGFQVGPVTDVIIDGHPGKQFEMDNAIDIDTCTGNPWLPQWTFDGASEGVPVPADASSLPRSHQRIAVLDVDGTRVLLQAWTMSITRPDEIEAAWAVFDSIDFQ